MSESQAVKDFIAKFSEHLKRADVMLDYFGDALDKAVAIVEREPHETGDMHAKLEFVLCIFPLAPLDKIQKCIAEGGLVCAIIGTKLEWTTAAIRATGGVRGVQLVACSSTEATIIYMGGATIELPNPGKQILAVFLLWPGG